MREIIEFVLILLLLGYPILIAILFTWVDRVHQLKKENDDLRSELEIEKLFRNVEQTEGDEEHATLL